MIEGADRDLFVETLNQAVGEGAGQELDGRLADLGWHDALADDPRTATSVLFDLQGRAVATSRALDAVIAGALGLEASPDTVVVLPLPGAAGPPGQAAAGAIEVAGLAHLTDSTTEVVVVVGGDETTTALVPVATLTVEPVHGLDPALGMVRVSGVVEADLSPAASWATARARARLALAHELVGCSRTMLRLARDHAVERVQFGQPISGFQAVRHRLAEALVAVEAADAATAVAWDEGSALAAAAAKAIAGRSARVVARHAQQVLAGIGFTTEHDLHRYVRRALALDSLFGDARTLTRDLGRRLLADRRLPDLAPL